MLKTALIGLSGNGRRGRVNAVDYSLGYLTETSGLTGGVATGFFLFSCWFKVDGAAAQQGIAAFRDSATSSLLEIMVFGDTINVYCYKNASTNYFSKFSGVVSNLRTGWHHLLIFMNHTTGTRTFQAYLDDSALPAGGESDSGTGFTLNYGTLTARRVGRTQGSENLLGGLSEVYFAPNQSLDLSVAANREKFILNGKPVALGDDGSLPTGVAPLVYISNPAATADVNKGTGGNFTISGSITDYSSSPSD